MSDAFYHKPVMSDEVTQYLITKNDGYYIDCTFGGGGHSLYFLEQFDNIKIIAFDQDIDSYNRFLSNDNIIKFKDRIIFCKSNFRHVLNQLKEKNIEKVNGLFADLGVSSKQLDDMARGFSFNSNDPLDMRMDQNQTLSAYDIINSYNQEELERIFFQYGEESFSRQIAKKIIESRIKGKIKTCRQLSDIVCSVKWKKDKINPSTKIFQALRIYVNDELGSLQEMLSSLPQVLSLNARAVILTYHSLEDRIVKQSFKNFQSYGLKIINKKVIIANETEIENNPRSRSAKMRVLENCNV
ncbi:MAG: 16S rRNA (cytosine(1402)-N(4))-methyltransferase RsmH [Endomicrobiaceae bacterium]|nr:16S rRNA (cytosine(1402)-N(4))-methyltransferase RsmH [Endomicrobiaceae bacterium]